MNRPAISCKASPLDDPGRHAMTRQVLTTNPQASEPNLYIAWYETWRAEQDARRAAEEAARLQMQRDIRWIVYALIGWTFSAALAGGAALVLMSR